MWMISLLPIKKCKLNDKMNKNNGDVGLQVKMEKIAHSF